MGDFNMHIDDIMNVDNLIFNDTMEALGLSQQVRTPTHRQGNTLDMIYMMPTVNSSIETAKHMGSSQTMQ